MIKSPINLIAIYLLSSLMLCALMYIFGYHLLINGYTINIVPSAIILCLTVLSFTKKDSNRLTSLFSMFLPLIAVLYFVIKTFTVTSNVNTSVFHYLITCLCCLAIFFSSGLGKRIKIGLGIAYFLLFMPVLLMSMFGLAIGNDGFDRKVLKSEMSPNSVYLAEIIDNDRGALGGGGTRITVTRQNRDLNILIGTLKKNPKAIYTAGEFEGMTLRWETDKILYINEKEYRIE